MATVGVKGLIRQRWVYDSDVCVGPSSRLQ